MAKQNYPPVLHRQQQHYTAVKMRILLWRKPLITYCTASKRRQRFKRLNGPNTGLSQEQHRKTGLVHILQGLAGIKKENVFQSFII